jgi:hypothetical protein
LIEAQDPSIADYSEGPSPGGAAAELGVSRQMVHYCIRSGKLNALAVYDGKRLSHYTISKSSLAEYQAELRAKVKVEMQRLMDRL